MTPLSYDPLDYAAEFSTEMCPEGVVAVSGEKLRIFGVERLGEVFNQAALPLRSAMHTAMVPGHWYSWYHFLLYNECLPQTDQILLIYP